jgi:hypothetical protein
MSQSPRRARRAPASLKISTFPRAWGTPNLRGPRHRHVRTWPTGLATLAGRQGRYRSKFRRDDYEARRLKVTQHGTLWCIAEIQHGGRSRAKGPVVSLARIADPASLASIRRT